MTNGKIIEQVEHTGNREQPAEKEMPAARGSERIIAGNGQPTWEPARLRTEDALLDSEKTRGVDLPAVNIYEASYVIVILAGANSKERIARV